jgi:hypothetical protein
MNCCHHCDQSKVVDVPWRIEYERPRLQHVRQRARVVPGIGRNLRERHVICRLDERAKLPIGDRRAIDPEAATVTR